MDLLEDLHGILLRELENFSYSMKTGDVRKLLTGLINLQEKTISIKRRTVHVSNELSTKEIEKPYDVFLKQISNKFKNGKDVNPHLSKWSLEAKKKDLLLYDWGIHHLHINNQFDDKGFIERSDFLLFFMLKENDVYLIDVTKHRLEDGTEFSQQNLLEIIKCNWPHLLDAFKMEGATGLTEEYDDKMHSLSRNAGSFTLVEIDGEVFLPMGGGINTARTSVAHTQKVDYLLDFIDDLENHLTTTQKKIKEITSQFKIVYSETDFKLVLEEKVFYAIETRAGRKVGVLGGFYECVFGHLFKV